MERDSWMVELPTGSSSLNFDLMQRHVTHFSRRGVADRDAGAGWTDDPEERRRKEAGLTAKTSIDIARAMARRKVEEDKAKKTKEIVEQYNVILILDSFRFGELEFLGVLGNFGSFLFSCEIVSISLTVFVGKISHRISSGFTFGTKSQRANRKGK